jgi:hypothetical protein
MDFEIVFFRIDNTATAQAGAHRHTAVWLPDQGTAFSTGGQDDVFSISGPVSRSRHAEHAELDDGLYYRADLGFGWSVYAGQTHATTTLDEIAEHAERWSKKTAGASTHYPNNCRGYADEFIREFSNGNAELIVQQLTQRFRQCT